MTTGKLAPPPGLSPGNKRFWAAIVAGWTLTDEGLAILKLACEARERADQAGALLREQGLVVKSPRGATRPHPGVRIRERAEAAFLQALRQLGLE